MERVSQQRFETARVHTRLYMIKAFFGRISKASSNSVPSNVVAALTDLAILFALYSIEKDSGLFLKSAFLTSEDTDTVTSLVDEYNFKVRQQAIPLVDSFNLSDYFINSPIGNYNGDVYKDYFHKVVRRNPNYSAKAPYFER